MSNPTKKAIMSGAIAASNLNPITSVITTFFKEYASRTKEENNKKNISEIFEILSKHDNLLKEKDKIIKLFNPILRDMDKNKIHLYANSLINTIKNKSIDDIKICDFLNYLGDFTALHIDALSYFNQQHTFNNHNLHLNLFQSQSKKDFIIELIESDTKIFSGQYELLDNILDELHTKRLIRVSKLEDISISKFDNKQISRYTTDLGREFLNFIEKHNE